MRILAAVCAVLVVLGGGCAAPGPQVSKTHKVKIKVDNVNKVTKIKPVDGHLKDSIEFTAEAGPITIIIPTTDFDVVSSPAGTQNEVRDFTIMELEKDQSAVLFVPEYFLGTEEDQIKKREIWYLVICGTGTDAYPGEDNSPPRIIIRKR